MKKILLALAFIIFVTPKGVDTVRNVIPSGIIVDNGALMSNGFPSHMQVCQDVSARSAPLETGIIVKTIRAGEIVQIRDKGMGYAQYWVRISADPIMWIPIASLCKR